MTAHPQSAKFERPIARQKSINLALQGGGSHGAFTRGVLDRLLEEDQLTIDGVSATSAVSINAVVLACGLAVGGRAEAKRALKHFWQRLSAMAASSILQPSIVDKMMGNFGLDYSAGYLPTNILCQLLSPYQFNPFNLNPLRDLLEETVDFRRIREQTAVKLFLCATNVQSCKVEIFRGRELTSDHVLASSCLPFLMHAVEIGGERYWDGGFIANPALFPLIYECEARDSAPIGQAYRWARRPDMARSRARISANGDDCGCRAAMVGIAPFGASPPFICRGRVYLVRGRRYSSGAKASRE
jgi:NTE family protein